MTTTTTYQGMEPGAKNSSRVLCPPGGASNISFGTDEEKPARKNKMASNIFAEPDDPHAHRRNNPPSGEASGVLCGEPSAPLRRCQPAIVYDNGCPGERQANNNNTKEDILKKVGNRTATFPIGKTDESEWVLSLFGYQLSSKYLLLWSAEESKSYKRDQNDYEPENNEEVQEQKEDGAQPSVPTASGGTPSGRRNPPGGKSSLILG